MAMATLSLHYCVEVVKRIAHSRIKLAHSRIKAHPHPFLLPPEAFGKIFWPRSCVLAGLSLRGSFWVYASFGLPSALRRGGLHGAKYLVGQSASWRGGL